MARAAYGRLVAYLAARSRDVAAAEDALADAFQAALRTWPERGVPDSPQAWLLTAARRRMGEGARHARVREAAAPTLALINDAAPCDDADIPDERLRLLLVCAHSAIDPAARAPLMLQAVLGLDAARIASAFLVSPAAMSQRLVRAKARIRDAGIAFAPPGRDALPERLEAVLQAIYAAYGAGWEEVAGADARGADLAAEAMFLARVVCDLAPGEPEAQGLLALMLHCEARRGARRSDDGAFVPLDAQDTRLWSRALMAEAERRLQEAAGHARPGRFQLEAAIQSVHAGRAFAPPPPPEVLVGLYGALLAFAPTVGARLGHAAATARAHGPQAALTLLDAIPAEATRTHQTYWVLRAHLLDRLGEPEAAARARETALGLTEDPAVRAFLQAQTRGDQAG